MTKVQRILRKIDNSWATTFIVLGITIALTYAFSSDLFAPVPSWLKMAVVGAFWIVVLASGLSAIHSGKERQK